MRVAASPANAAEVARDSCLAPRHPWLNSREPLDYAGVQAAVRKWQPFAGLVYFHLLLANLAEHDLLSESSPALAD
jgi:hypothetical protein